MFWLLLMRIVTQKNEIVALTIINLVKLIAALIVIQILVTTIKLWKYYEIIDNTNINYCPPEITNFLPQLSTTLLQLAKVLPS